jgi:hypothetical protein
MSRIAIAALGAAALLLVAAPEADATTLGVIVGGQLTDIAGGDSDQAIGGASDGLDPQLNFVIGGAYPLFQQGPFTARAELLYSRQGGRVSDDLQLRLDYVQLPVLAEIEFMPGPVTPHIVAGIRGSYLFQAKLGDADVRDSYKPLIYGWTVGAGAGMTAQAVGLHAELRYSRDFVGIFDNELRDLKVVNQTFGLQLGVWF